MTDQENMNLEEAVELLVLTDEDDNEITAQILDYVNYNGEEYAVLAEQQEAQAAAEKGDMLEIFFMRVVPVALEPGQIPGIRVEPGHIVVVVGVVLVEDDVEVAGIDAVLAHPPDADLEIPGPELAYAVEGRHEAGLRGPEVDEGRDEHVARDAGRAVEQKGACHISAPPIRRARRRG